MDNNIFNDLELAYSPLSSYDFARLKKDEDILKAIENSTLYIIAKRPVLYFNDVFINENSWNLEFEIHQNDNLNSLKCILPLDQKHLFSSDDDPITIRFWYNDKQYASEGTTLT